MMRVIEGAGRPDDHANDLLVSLMEVINERSDHIAPTSIIGVLEVCKLIVWTEANEGE